VGTNLHLPRSKKLWGTIAQQVTKDNNVPYISKKRKEFESFLCKEMIIVLEETIKCTMYT
jgi:hypothetical protein